MIIGKRGGLMLSIEEAFGDQEESAYGDSSAPNGTREVTFDRLRKYSGILMAYPLRSRLEPYLGVGFGILHTVGTSVGGTFTTPEDAGAAVEEAKNRGSTGFGSFVGGLQYRLSKKMVLYGQYQITTAPSDGSLLVGPTHTLVAGLRFGLGSAKEGVHGGGY
jgi:opacity protein-like surface antigen